MEDDSQVDYMVTDRGTDMKNWICDSVKDRGMNLSSRARVNRTQGNVSASVEDKGSTTESKIHQVCLCGWRKVTGSGCTRGRRVRRHSQVSLGREFEKLVKERRQLRKQWKKAQ